MAGGTTQAPKTATAFLEVVENRLGWPEVWSRVQVGEIGECWPWLGKRTPKGYGILVVDGHELRVHRVAFALTHGVDPGDLDVLHHCDNPPCCNSFFCLWLGTNADNQADMDRKGRRSPPPISQPGKAMPRGLASGLPCKLTPKQVAEIRASDAPQRLLAVRYGVSQPRISQIRRGVAW